MMVDFIGETSPIGIVVMAGLSTGLSLLGLYGMTVFFGLQRQSLDEAPEVNPLEDMP